MRAKAVSFALALFLVSCAASRKEFRRVPKGIAEHYELQGQVIKLTADYVYIDMGKKDRLEPGWFFEVIGFDEALYHPETGRLLGKEAEVKAHIELAGVMPEYSKARIVSQYDKIEIGDRVKFHHSVLRIAVLRFELVAGEDPGIAEKATTEMIEAFKKAGSFDVMDRRDLGTVLDEQKLAQQDSPLVQEADIVVTGRIWDETLSLEIEARAIDLKTGRVILVKRMEKKKYPGLIKKSVEYSTWFLKELGSLVAYISGAFVRGFIEANN